jgi:hypothetical protein
MVEEIRSRLQTGVNDLYGVNQWLSIILSDPAR